MNGTTKVLNVGLGDLTLAFNQHDPAEVEKAKSLVMKLIEQGYALMVRNADGTYDRVTAFDPALDCYIISEGRAAPVAEGIVYEVRRRKHSSWADVWRVAGGQETQLNERAIRLGEARSIAAERARAEEGAIVRHIDGESGIRTRLIPRENAETTAVARSAGG